MMIVLEDGRNWETAYNIGDTVYLKTDPTQSERIITFISVYPSESHAYNLTLGNDNSMHYEFELSAEKDQFKALGVNVSSDD